MLKLHINTELWRTHQREVVEQCPGIVPVAKGCGYGFGNGLLAGEVERLGLGTVAVGTAHEVAELRETGWAGDIVVLNPWRPFDALATQYLADPHVITTVSRVEDVQALTREHPGTAVLVEVETSMHRHGIAPDELPRADLSALDVRGWTVHLPASGSLDEARALTAAIARHPQADKGIWLSHLSFDDYRTLAAELDVPLRMRVGTRLWLGNPKAYRATGTVLDVHQLPKGTPVGYHGEKTPSQGCLVVISGGTAHGVALAAPATARSFKQRLIPFAEAFDEFRGQVTSPFIIDGRKRPFAEPPHMHASLVFVDGPGRPVTVGDEVPVTVRMTTTTFDECVFE